MREQKREGELRNQLKAVRTRLGLSQQELAQAAGVARQTIGGIEAGDYALSMTVALRLARALGCPVEEIFWLEEDLTAISAAVLDGRLPNEVEEEASFPVSLGSIGGRWVATPLVGDAAYRLEMVAADGVASWDVAEGGLRVRLQDSAEVFAATVSVTGCTPALSLWARAAERQHPGLRVAFSYANSMEALARLARADTHLAGIHLQEGMSGVEVRDNASFVRAALPGEATALVHLGVWEEGLLVARGNPKGLRRGADLAQPGVQVVNRESGAGMRRLLDSSLAADGVLTADVLGYEDLVADHFSVARTVRDRHADAGVSTRAMADAFGLSFVPLQSVRYDFALRRESLELPAIRQLLSVLHHRWVRSQLATVAGYDTTRTGEITNV